MAHDTDTNKKDKMRREGDMGNREGMSGDSEMGDYDTVGSENTGGMGDTSGSQGMKGGQTGTNRPGQGVSGDPTSIDEDDDEDMLDKELLGDDDTF